MNQNVYRQAHQDHKDRPGFGKRQHLFALFRRLRHDSKRPLLQVADPLARLRELFARRDPLYRQSARFIVETGRPSVPTLVNMILMQLELSGAVDPDHVPSLIDATPPPPPRS